MTQLAILTSTERKNFDMLPKFTTEERSLYFSLAQIFHIQCNAYAILET